MSDPDTVLAQSGFKLDSNKKIRVIEETASEAFLTIPVTDEVKVAAEGCRLDPIEQCSLGGVPNE